MNIFRKKDVTYKATKIAEHHFKKHFSKDYSQKYKLSGVVGIIFLGLILIFGLFF